MSVVTQSCTVAWHHAAFETPPDWEITAYSLDSRAGRLEFSTRDGFQAQFAWQRCRRTPDVRRILSDFHRRTLEGRDPKRAERFDGLVFERVAAFDLGTAGEAEPAHAAACSEDGSVLLRWTFPRFNPAFRDSIIRPLLTSVRDNVGAWRRWAVYGLDIELPREFRPESLVPMPANVTLVCEAPRRGRCSFHRWGLPGELLRGQTLADFYHRLLRTNGARIGVVRSEAVHGMTGAAVEFRQRAEHGLERLYGTWPGRGTVWHDTGEKRICAVERCGPWVVDNLELDRIVRRFGFRSFGERAPRA